MNRTFLTIACFLIFISVVNAESVQDMSGEFSFICPEGWEKIDKLPHSSLILKLEDGARMIMIFDKDGKGPILEVEKIVDETKENNINKVISSTIIKLKNGKQASKVIIKTEHPSREKLRFRQVHYLIALDSGKRLSILCMVNIEDGDSYDSVFDNFVNSIN